MFVSGLLGGSRRHEFAIEPTIASAVVFSPILSVPLALFRAPMNDRSASVALYSPTRKPVLTHRTPAIARALASAERTTKPHAEDSGPPR